MRVGSGLDVHRFGGEGPLMIGTLEVPFERGLEGHSDGDVVAHALCDALLAAAGLPDIGHHFPPGDPQWAGASGARLIGAVGELVAERGARPVNAHAVVVCEWPKLAPLRESMQRALSGLIGAPVSIHATTTEGLGFTGREEGIMCQAVALVEMEAPA